ncbi:hypothetical protein MTP03_29400 [Tsukamurella sp. PLM1]|nr:hypothetical protein MTP03_29400 [Tsukamurella sp. PLM1]
MVSHGGYFRPSEKVRADWADRGIDTGPSLDAALDEVWHRSGVTEAATALSLRDELLEKGCAELGLPVRAVGLADDGEAAAGEGRWGPPAGSPAGRTRAARGSATPRSAAPASSPGPRPDPSRCRAGGRAPSSRGRRAARG